MSVKIAISLGCPAGIGPQIVARGLSETIGHCHPVLFGHRPTFDKAMAEMPDAPPVDFVHVGGPDTPITAPNDAAASVGMASLQKAVDAVLDGHCAGITTAPVSKEVIARVSPGFTGHTEYLAQRAGLGRDDVTMLFASQKLVVGLLTTHLPLKDIPETITRERYKRTLEHITWAARRITGLALPHVAVSALNPHAGEAGLLGTEELDVIAPFCREFDGRDAHVHGPIPADAVFREAFAGKYHGVIAAYHDQALIPLKLSGFGNAVNVTGGLPFVRTSPDHGTAYELVASNSADAIAMTEAIKMAVALISGAS